MWTFVLLAARIRPDRRQAFVEFRSSTDSASMVWNCGDIRSESPLLETRYHTPKVAFAALRSRGLLDPV